MINGGDLKATGHGGGAGIGAGGEAGGINLTVNGGTVNGDGGVSGQGAGIGGGYSSDTWGSVTINDGTVTANGGNSSPGIGSGNKGNASGLTVNIHGGEVPATGHSDSAGIGGGAEAGNGSGDEGANVNITGGLVIVNSDHTAIGHGGTDDVMGNLFIADNMKVYAGNDGTNYERDGMPFTAAERVGACQYRHCARVEPCDHPVPVADNIPVVPFDAVTEYAHKRSACVYCGQEFAPESHDFDDTGMCVVCAYNGSFARVSFDANGGTGEGMNDAYAAPGSALTLPDCAFTAPEGRVFGGWRIEDELYRAGDWVVVVKDVTAFAQWVVPFGTPDFVLPEGVESIEESAFEGIASSVVSIPEGCRAIGAYAFRNCPNLTQIRVPAGCVIGESAFDGCEHVTLFGVAGSSAEQYCENHDNCVFVAE